MEVKDPLEEVPPSEAPPSEAVVADVGFGAGNVQSHGQASMVLPGSTPITLTPKGILVFLGRKERPKPLLRLICRACGATSHDADPIVEGTCHGVSWLRTW